jgi:topB: DNA topoisomerase III
MSKFLVIAEKPSVAQSYAKNLSAYKREDGYLEGESCIVSWCLGHLAEYAQPENMTRNMKNGSLMICQSFQKHGS